MSYAQLKAFHALALERSFLRAADRLRLTQPAISIQVRNLEKESSRILFRRDGHTVGLTDAGRELFELTSQIFEAEHQAQQLLAVSENDLRQTIHLGADGPHVALDLIVAARRVIPNIRFRVSLANAELTWENLLSLKVDAAILADPKSDSRIVAKTIAIRNLIALIPVDHVLAGRDTVAFQDLAAHALVFREQGSNTQKLVDRAFARHGLFIEPDLVMGSREGVGEAVACGIGIGFGFEREFTQVPNCKAVDIAGPKNINTDKLICLKGQKHNPVVEKLFLIATESMAL